jgi:hypothetical protein
MFWLNNEIKNNIFLTNQDVVYSVLFSSISNFTFFLMDKNQQLIN